MNRNYSRIFLMLCAAILVVLCARPYAADAQTGNPELDAQAWLRYARLDSQAAKAYEHLPNKVVVVLGESVLLRTAQQELIRGAGQMLGRTLTSTDLAGMARGENFIALTPVRSVPGTGSTSHPASELAPDGYRVETHGPHGYDSIEISGDDRGILYGVFALLSKIARGESIANLNEYHNPYAPIRWVNQWDNLDGRIERGYGGRSIFFDNGKVRDDLTRAGEYARLLASIGINACTINNVNANPAALEDSFIVQIKRIADAFRPWGVQLSMSVDLSSPKVVGASGTAHVETAASAVRSEAEGAVQPAQSAAAPLDTFDPLDPRVAEWWQKKVDYIYTQIPDFAGFVVKADSEGRSGPSAYNRTHADAANVIARALKPHGGVVFYRAFVYNHHLDWRNLKNDRARAAYDNFRPLDGQFADNAIVQIKNGPIDFQVREPVSPLFAGLHHTNQAIELQVTQEYMGQQKHLCFLVPMWKEVLDFDMRIDDKSTPVKDLVSGRVFHSPLGGLAGVANVGLDANWIGSPMAMANLYGFGRLAWNPNLTSETIVDEWTRLTFGSDPLVVQTVKKLQLDSWPVYESYTGNLGVGTLTNITGNHYDPGPMSSEENGWGQWHRADHSGIGMDRTVATGTGFVGQYPPAVQKLYETLAACPDNLLLFFHHVPYTHVLHSGKTVVQHFYDAHYEGAERAADFITQWKSLEGHMDDARYQDILARFQFQAGEAIKWRDTICNWIYRLSGIPDKKGRLGPPQS